MDLERLAQDRTDTVSAQPLSSCRTDRGKNHNGDVLEKTVLTQVLKNLPSIHSRHHQIEHDEFRHSFFHVRDGLDPIARFAGVKTDPPENLSEKMTDGRVVIDDEHVGTSRRRWAFYRCVLGAL